MKKILMLLMLICALTACNESVRRTLPNTKGHFKGYGSVYTFNVAQYSPEFVGSFPVYRKNGALIIYVDEDNDVSYTLKELSTPRSMPGLSQEFKYVYDNYYYVEGDISY